MMPLCFVLMPCGTLAAEGGNPTDFDAVFEEIIAPAIRDAGFSMVTGREDAAGGLVNASLLERLLLCDYGIIDVTGENATALFGLGARHAWRPHGTVLLHAAGRPPPFATTLFHTQPYGLTPHGLPARATEDRKALAAHLRNSLLPGIDSPILHLLDEQPIPDIKRLKTDLFRDRATYTESVKEELASARRQGAEAVRAVERRLGDVATAETGVVIDLLLSYRSVKAWQDVIALVGRMSPLLAGTVMVREQYAMALNRVGRSVDAERELLDVVRRHGKSSESLGLLGRVYKDRWEAARKAGDAALAEDMLRKAADTYCQGFEADWRDAYPGVNALTLMEVQTPPDPRRNELLPVVRYAVERRMAAGVPDYWDMATLLELAVLAGDEAAARAALADALTHVREPWEPESTANNLRLIRAARAARGEATAWLAELEAGLLARA